MSWRQIVRYDPVPHVGTLQREHWNGQPTLLGDRFGVSKMHDDKQLAAACRLWTHQLGWEVRLEINADLQRSEVFRSQNDVLTAGRDLEGSDG